MTGFFRFGWTNCEGFPNLPGEERLSESRDCANPHCVACFV